jgi:hypothetical protein
MRLSDQYHHIMDVREYCTCALDLLTCSVVMRYSSVYSAVAAGLIIVPSFLGNKARYYAPFTPGLASAGWERRGRLLTADDGGLKSG